MSNKKGMSKEEQERRAEMKAFEDKLAAGEIHSYDQFPPNTWGVGQLVGISYDEEMVIFNDLKSVGEATSVDEAFARQFFGKAKDLILAGREPEGLVYAYWVGKLVGRAEKKRMTDMMKLHGFGGVPRAR